MPPLLSAFALPDRLAAKASPAQLRDDERHFAAIAASLERWIADLTRRLNAARRSEVGSGGEAVERDMEVRRLGSRLRALSDRNVGGADYGERMTGYESVSEIDIAAAPEQVWAALTDNARFGEAMFGTEVVTDWQIGSPIVYQGEFEGKAFEDKGELLELTAPTCMRVSHFSPTSGDDDKPENYHELRFDLEPTDDGTHVTLTQDNNATEKAAEHSQGNWDAMLGLLKKVVER